MLVEGEKERDTQRERERERERDRERERETKKRCVYIYTHRGGEVCNNIYREIHTYIYIYVLIFIHMHIYVQGEGVIEMRGRANLPVKRGPRNESACPVLPASAQNRYVSPWTWL